MSAAPAPVTDAPRDEADAPARRRGLPALGGAAPIYVALVVVVVTAWAVVTADGGSFLTTDNLVDMLQRSVGLGIVAVGQTVAILAGSLDLSVGYVISAASLIMAEVAGPDESRLWLGIAAVLALGVAVGLVNGVVITKLRVNAFIATLGTAFILRGILDARYDGPFGTVPESFKDTLGYTRFGWLPMSVLLFAAVAAAVWIVLRHTRLGHRIYAVGGDRDVATLSGVRTDRTVIWAHVLCSVCAAIAGLFIASRLGAGAPRVGVESGYDLESIAAVVLGGTALAGGRGGVAGTVAGVLVLAVLDNVFNQLEVDPFLKDVVRGVVIVAAVAVYARRTKREELA
jgi:ribose transport system permease protein